MTHELLFKSEMDPLYWGELDLVCIYEWDYKHWHPSVSFGIEQVPWRENPPFERFVKHNLHLMYHVKNSKQ